MNDKKIAQGPQFTIPGWLLPHVAEAEGWGPVAGPETTCWVEGCGRPPVTWGLCKAHAKRARRAWHPSPSEIDRARQPQPERPSRIETRAQTR